MYEQTLETVSAEMASEPAETQLEYRLDCLLRELDEVCALAVNPETVDLVESQHRLIGMILTRAQLVASLLEVRKSPNLRVVCNG